MDTAQAKYDQQVEQYNSQEAGILADHINLKVMEQELEAARAEVAKVDEDISYTTIRSPIPSSPDLKTTRPRECSNSSSLITRR